MMRVLHCFPKSDALSARYASLLAAALSDSVEVMTTDDVTALGKQWSDFHPDIIHLFGTALPPAGSDAVRVVLSPCGCQPHLGSHPWVIIARSPMEHQRMQQLMPECHVEMVCCPIITKTTTMETCAAAHVSIYQRLMQSHPLPLLSDDGRQMLAAALKVGLMGDPRCLHDMMPTEVSAHTCQLLANYAEAEGLLPLVQRGLSLMGKDTMSLQPGDYYLPMAYETPVDMSGADIISLLSDMSYHGPSMLRLCNLCQLLASEQAHDDELLTVTAQEHLTSALGAALQLAQENMLWDEGYMPMLPIESKLTRRWRQLIINHLQL